MELSFVLAALRRRLWLVALFALLGALPGLLADPPTGNEYRSVAKLMIVQPTVGSTNFFAADPDRYVLGQLSVLGSANLVNEVALDVGRSITFVREAVTIEHDPGTDIVTLEAITNEADLSRQVAQSYVEVYMTTLEDDRSDGDELQRLNDNINRLRAVLVELNSSIADQMGPIVNQVLGDRDPKPLPSIDQIAPALVTERNVAEAELRQLVQQRNELISDSRLRINTRIIQYATQPSEPIPPGGQFLLAGGLFAGAMLGVVAAMAWARFSTKVLDIETASEILAAPVVSELPHYRSLARQPLAAFQSLPRSAIPVIDQLCVRAEAKARINEPLIVAVVGTQRGPVRRPWPWPCRNGSPAAARRLFSSTQMCAILE